MGGNNSAAEMGPAFGAGIRTRAESVALIAIFSILGAVTAGGKVVHTIGTDILGGPVLCDNLPAVIIILLASASVVAAANVLRVPLATAHAMVGAVLGIGLYVGSVNWHKTALIVAWWIATPVAALVLSFLVSRYAYAALNTRLEQSNIFGLSSPLYRVLITVSGCYLAYSAGSNGLAKAVGPLVGAKVLTAEAAAVMGGIGMAAGAILIGSRLLETVGKGITQLDPLKAVIVELISGTILLFASLYGIPVSLAEIVTCSVIGFSCGISGIRFTSRNAYVKVMARLWPVCPVLTAAMAFGAASLVQPVRVFLAGL
ncbi:MAG TPA: inorganic phosphate transporter [Candidatus Obscuribacterales bacterium]